MKINTVDTDIRVGEILEALDILQFQVKRDLANIIKKQEPELTSDDPFEHGEFGIHRRYIRRIGQRFIAAVLEEKKKAKKK